MGLKSDQLVVIAAILKRLKEKSKDPKELRAEIARLDRQIDGLIADLTDYFNWP